MLHCSHQISPNSFTVVIFSVCVQAAGSSGKIVNKQLASLRSVEIIILFAYFSTVVLNTSHLNTVNVGFVKLDNLRIHTYIHHFYLPSDVIYFTFLFVFLISELLKGISYKLDKLLLNVTVMSLVFGSSVG